jgi:hypothetical protein
MKDKVNLSLGIAETIKNYSKLSQNKDMSTPVFTNVVGLTPKFPVARQRCRETPRHHARIPQQSSDDSSGSS